MTTETGQQQAAPAERYMPGLDGVRALAVAVVVAYHLGIGFTPGGLLGVAVFFTLSGYLITDILLWRWIGGEADLTDFWRRRARRLLPGLFLMLAVVCVWVVVHDRTQLGEVRGQAFAAVIYINNWWQIFQHISYFARFGPASPLNHLWSLAVEEQFYLVWPWLLLLGVRLIREPGAVPGVRPRLALATVVLAAISAIEMAALYHPSFDSSRVYEGTDTRAFGLLFGAALAMVWPSRRLTGVSAAGAGRTLDLAGGVGLVVIGVMVWRTGQYSSFLYHGGLVLVSLASVLVIACVAHPATRLGRLLAAPVMRWLGQRSYGIYLWHVPVIVLTSPKLASGFDGLRALLQVALTLILADLSWRFVESPIRRGKLGVLVTHARLVGFSRIAFPERAATVGVITALVAAIACTAAFHTAAPSLAAAKAGSGPAPPPTSAPAAHKAQFVSQVTSGNPSFTSCRSVVHIGDSTSEGLTSADYLPNPKQRISWQYRKVGATHQIYEISGGTSIVETIDGEENAYDVAKGLVADGYHGCWVIALGTNDSADVAVGSNVGLAARIHRMMSVIGHDPVMWVNVRSLLSSTAYSETNMAAWDSALDSACTKYPNMRVFNWAGVVEPQWFITDGIHFTSTGYRYRAKLIAEALARSFPRGGSSDGCLVNVRRPSLRPVGTSPPAATTTTGAGSSSTTTSPTSSTTPTTPAQSSD